MEPRSRPYRSLNVSSSRWTSYAVAGLATAAASVPCAEAEIHYSGRLHLHLDGHDLHYFSLPLVGVAASLRFLRGSSFSGGFESIRAVAPSGGYVFGGPVFCNNLPLGRNLSLFGDGSSRYLNLILPSGTGQFAEPGIGFAGFRFDVGQGVQYGWVRMRTNKGAPSEHVMTVLEYAYADPGEPLKVGQRPKEPVTGMGSLGLLAAGAVGLTAWRKSRQINQRQKIAPINLTFDDFKCGSVTPLIIP